jgi:hypothetical protein
VKLLDPFPFILSKNRALFLPPSNTQNLLLILHARALPYKWDFGGDNGMDAKRARNGFWAEAEHPS